MPSSRNGPRTGRQTGSSTTRPRPQPRGTGRDPVAWAVTGPYSKGPIGRAQAWAARALAAAADRVFMRRMSSTRAGRELVESMRQTHHAGDPTRFLVGSIRLTHVHDHSASDLVELIRLTHTGTSGPGPGTRPGPVAPLVRVEPAPDAGNRRGRGPIASFSVTTRRFGSILGISCRKATGQARNTSVVCIRCRSDGAAIAARPAT